MIGIFDSGRGGIASFMRVRQLLPHADIAYLADRKNAPYGTKSPEVLRRLVCEDIRRLYELGAKKILIACCTASSVYDTLPQKWRSISLPIISPTAKYAASVTENGRIAVIATEATVKSRRFSTEIKNRLSGAEVTEIPAQRLVGLIEHRAERRELEDEARRIEKLIRPLGCDTLVLGCTHFSHATKIFESILGNIRIADSATVGAEAIVNDIKIRENGKILYT